MASWAVRRGIRMAAIIAAGVALAIPAPAVPDAPAPSTLAVLPGGVRVITCPRGGAPLVAIDIWVRAGSAWEEPGQAGAAHFLEHMVFKGTPARGPGQIDAAIETLGSLLNAGTLRDSAHFFATVPSARCEAALDVVADGIRHAKLDPREFERERGVILDEMALAESEPEHAALTALFASLFPADPYGRAVLGASPGLRTITRDAVAAFYRRRYAPANVTVVLAGDIDAQRAARAVDHAFGGWTGAQPAAAASVATPASPAPAAGPDAWAPASAGIPVSQPRTVGGSTPVAVPEAVSGAARSACAVGFRLGRAPTDADAAAGAVLAVMVRDGLLSRLRREDRDRLRAADPAVEFARLARDGVLTVVCEGGASGALPAAVREIAARLRSGSIAQGAVRAAAGEVLGRALTECETLAALARSVGLADQVAPGSGRPGAFEMAVRRVDAGAVTALAAALLDPARCAVGSAGSLR